MKEMKQYWIDNTPSITDIEEAYEIVSKNDCIVELNWHFPYSGNYKVRIRKTDVDSMSAKKFFDERIPHCYGV